MDSRTVFAITKNTIDTEGKHEGGPLFRRKGDADVEMYARQTAHI